MNSQEFDNYTGKDDFHARYTVYLGQLIKDGLFTFDSELLNWKDYAYSDEQYNRMCEYIKARFYWREISIEPFLEWAMRFSAKIKFELCPKYNRLYEAFEDINILQDSDEYGKERHIESAYPETLLSENSDYLSYGKDNEFEHVKTVSPLKMQQEIQSYQDIDNMFANELENFFVSLYTTNINGF